MVKCTHIGAKLISNLQLNYYIYSCSLCGREFASHQAPIKGTYLGECLHPAARYVGEESGKNCRGQAYERERWQCPDCGASWFEGVRFLPMKKVV
jgi:hypothetical protein